ncbi:hypothetical protein OPKNFCMD_2753 [Methylobacterium crusticola]|uniref:Uncharacterized protein n=1 Tax=Methylobacterium crusticola TaxID=1697972 RepID=A0ABQ4QZM2_9HYPH|nr:hypothetical protein [Methylobacterium crusticola]GJD50017.1 hypothetical protein OPKNFCMD_2753 [Methylobacterium crusticola]
MPPAAAIALARALLVAEGFLEVARGARSDSVYLRGPGTGGQVRVAGHARTPRRRRQYPEVVASLVITGPLSEAGVRARVAATLRDFRARRGRPGAGAGAPPG